MAHFGSLKSKTYLNRVDNIACRIGLPTRLKSRPPVFERFINVLKSRKKSDPVGLGNRDKVGMKTLSGREVGNPEISGRESNPNRIVFIVATGPQRNKK